jgi:aspartate/methionine/tyrosine aminotransferase
MPIRYREVISDPEVATGFSDTAMIASYLDQGSPAGELIYLGFGETWTQVAPGLAAALAQPMPAHSHGYVISQYGLPALQRTLRSYIATTHRLPIGGRVGRDYEVAVTSGGTRNAMFDFARLLQLDPAMGVAAPGRVPVAVSTLPGWDYAGVIAGLGYQTRFVPLRERAGCQPLPADFDEVLNSITIDPELKLALVVINAQHNPTGINWNPGVVRHMIRTSLAAGAAILIDDAYFGVHDPELVPTSALAILLAELPDAPPSVHRRWLAVRSLGKQFHCSGWGIGAATANPRTLDAMVNTVQLQRSFASAIPLQQAMAYWLADAAALRYLAEQNQGYADKRTAVGKILRRELGYPPHAYRLGECGAFLRVHLPPAHRRDSADLLAFRQEALNRAGVLLGVDRWSTGRSDEADRDPPCFRVYLGPPRSVITDALIRLARAGYTFDGSPTAS